MMMTIKKYCKPCGDKPFALTLRTVSFYSTVHHLKYILLFMKHRNIIFLLLPFLLFAAFSCQRKANGAAEGGDTIKLKYAEHLNIVKHKDFTLVTLSDPWNKGKILHTYVLVPADEDLPESLPEGTVVRTPLKRAIVTTSVHCGLIMDLDKRNSIAGVCDLTYMNLPWIKQQCKEGKIADCGNSMSPTIEKIIDAGADAVLISPFQNNGGYGRLGELKLPLIEVADYMETSALGRAEWMLFYGMLFGAEEKAETMFKNIEANYNNLKALAQKSNTRKSILIDKKSGSVWYVPGGNSTIAKVIADANANYPFAADKSSGSLALSFEAVLEKAGDADLWLIRYGGKTPAGYDMLLSEYQGYSQFKAFKEKEIYGCNTETTTFFEDTPFHPDMLLRDFIIIAHPDLNGLGSTKYYKKFAD